MVDLLDFATGDEPIEMQVQHPVTGGALNGTRLWLYGPDTPQHSKALQEVRRQARKRVMKSGKRALIEDDDEATGIMVLAHCVARWEGIALEGQELDCTPENVRRVFSHPKVSWLRDQAAEFIQDRENFLPKSETG